MNCCSVNLLRPNKSLAATGGITITRLSIGTSALSSFKINALIPASVMSAALDELPVYAVAPVEPMNAFSYDAAAVPPTVPP